MAVAQQTDSYVQEFAAELDRWQGRLRNLSLMAAVIPASARAPIEQGHRQLEAILRSASDMLERSRTVSSEEWMEIHPKITAALRTAQSCYNNLVADWAQM